MTDEEKAAKEAADKAAADKAAADEAAKKEGGIPEWGKQLQQQIAELTKGKGGGVDDLQKIPPTKPPADETKPPEDNKPPEGKKSKSFMEWFLG